MDNLAIVMCRLYIPWWNRSAHKLCSLDVHLAICSATNIVKKKKIKKQRGIDEGK